MSATRPRPKETGTLVGVRLQPNELAKLDGWRKQQDDLPTRPEAIRRLLLVATSVEGATLAELFKTEMETQKQIDEGNSDYDRELLQTAYEQLSEMSDAEISSWFQECFSNLIENVVGVEQKKRRRRKK